MTLGERINQLRKVESWTLSELSLRTELSISYLSDIERDRTEPTLKTLVKIAGAFGVKVVEILYAVELGEEKQSAQFNPLPF